MVLGTSILFRAIIISSTNLHFALQPGNRKRPPRIVIKPTEPVDGGGSVPTGNLVGVPSSLDRSTTIKVGDQVIDIDPDNVTTIKELGHGAYGIVQLIRHVPSGVQLAVKKIRASNLQDESRLLRDMEVLVKSRGCPNIV